MMEGISGEAASLAGHLQLDNLCWIYDNNKITIEGHTHLAFSEDVATRFIAYGWNVTRVGDANDLAMLDRAFETFKNTTGRPTLIIVDSHIGYGAPTKQDTHAAHGEPLGEQEIKLDQALLRLAGGREVPRARRGAEVLPGGHGRPRQDAARRLDDALRGLQGEAPAGSRRDPAHAEAAAAGRLGGGDPDLPRRREGHGRTRCVGEGAQRGRAEDSVADRRLRRPRAVDEDAAHLRGRRRLRSQRVRRPQLPLRHPRARDGRGHERPVALEGPALRLGLPDLQRLRPRPDSPRGDHGDPGHLRLHARFDRRRRRRTDASAGRTDPVAPRHSRPDHDPPRRRQRSRRKRGSSRWRRGIIRSR